jgi:hypothetical protein
MWKASERGTCFDREKSVFQNPGLVAKLQGAFPIPVPSLTATGAVKAFVLN